MRRLARYLAAQRARDLVGADDMRARDMQRLGMDLTRLADAVDDARQRIRDLERGDAGPLIRAAPTTRGSLRAYTR
jgi:hypothetical protein